MIPDQSVSQKLQPGKEDSKAEIASYILAARRNRSDPYCSPSLASANLTSISADTPWQRANLVLTTAIINA